MKLGKEISYSYKAIALSPMCISMSLYFIIFRIKNDGKYTDLAPKDKKIVIGATLFMVISVIATIVWFNNQIVKFAY